MKDEVYNWGSFLQSKMYAAGVTCSDCHEPHGLKVKVGADDVCSSCHQPERFASRKHHFHRESGKGASCVACHLRTETYMGVDPRHDHSFRAPRPDLTVALGRENAPNACNDCHRDRSAGWAARAVRRWYPGGQQEKPHYAFALHAGRTFQPGAEPLLLEVIRDPKQPGIVRGTAVSLLPAHFGPESLPALEKAARDPDPLVRLGTATTLEALPPKERVRIGVHLLWDPMRAVRGRQYAYIRNLAPERAYPLAKDILDSPSWKAILARGEKDLGVRSVESYLHRPAEELYEMGRDPDQVRNLAADPALAAVLADTRRRLEVLADRTNDPWLIGERRVP